MSVQQTRSALVQALMEIPEVAAIHNAKGLQLENMILTPAQGVVWLAIDFHPNPPVAIECGDAGEDEVVGFLQVTVSGPLGKGEAPLFDMLTLLANKFRLGTHWSYETQDVLVTSAGRAPGFPSEAHYKIPFTIWFQARYPRNRPTT